MLLEVEACLIPVASPPQLFADVADVDMADMRLITSLAALILLLSDVDEVYRLDLDGLGP